MGMGLAFLKGRVMLGVSHDVNEQVVRDCRSPSLLIPSALVPGPCLRTQFAFASLCACILPGPECGLCLPCKPGTTL